MLFLGDETRHALRARAAVGTDTPLDKLVMSATDGVDVPTARAAAPKQELFKNPVVGWFLNCLGAFPVRRGAADEG